MHYLGSLAVLMEVLGLMYAIFLQLYNLLVVPKYAADVIERYKVAKTCVDS
jgi:hypothetical protein